MFSTVNVVLTDIFPTVKPPSHQMGVPVFCQDTFTRANYKEALLKSLLSPFLNKFRATWDPPVKVRPGSQWTRNHRQVEAAYLLIVSVWYRSVKEIKRNQTQMLATEWWAVYVTMVQGMWSPDGPCKSDL